METFFKLLGMALVGIAIFGLNCVAAMYAWNNFFPEVLHLTKITFAQAMMLVCFGYAVVPTSSGSK